MAAGTTVGAAIEPRTELPQLTKWFKNPTQIDGSITRSNFSALTRFPESVELRCLGFSSSGLSELVWWAYALHLRGCNEVGIMNSQQDSRGRGQAKVVRSLEDADGFRCVDIFVRPDGSYGFKEFRRDPEDAGRWTLVGDYSHHSYATTDDALREAATSLPWLAASIKSKSQ